MRIVVCHDPERLETALASGADSELPLLATEVSAPVLRGLGPELAARAACDLRHVVAGRRRHLAGRLAERYALVQGRRFWDPDAGPPPPGPLSLTIFAAEGVAEPLEDARAVLEAFPAAEAPPFGLICGRDLGWISLQVARQLQVRSPGVRNVYIENQEPDLAGRVVPGLRLLGRAMAGALAEAGAGADGVLVIGGHSRAYCGPLVGTDGLAAVCAAPGAGLDGRCVSGAPCFFTGRPKLAMHGLRALRVLYNGCTTARPGDDPFGMSPHANHFDAALMAGVAEYIGNTGPGRSTPTDIAWFIAASSAGVSPAACVRTVDRVRVAEGRDRPLSMLYLGDASNPAWAFDPMPDEAAVTISGRSTRLDWRGQGSFAYAEVRSASLADACAAGALDARMVEGKAAQVSAAIAGDRLLLLVQRDTVGPLAIELGQINGDAAGPGREAEKALSRLSLLARRDAFAPVLADALGPLEREIGAERLAMAPGAGLLDLGTRRARARLRDLVLAASLDERLAARADELTALGWLMGGEFDPLARITARDGDPCPLCAGRAQVHEFELCGGAEARRWQRICAACGIVADLPSWPLAARIAAGPAFRDGTVCVDVKVFNPGPGPRHVSAGLALRGVKAGPGGARSDAWLDPGELATLPLRCHPAAELREFHWVHVNLASFGAVGALVAPTAPKLLAGPTREGRPDLGW